MNKKILVRFSEDAEQQFQTIEKEAALNHKEGLMLFTAITNKVELLKLDYHFGNPIAKSLIPTEYKIKYNIHNLFRIELPLFWRLLYSLIPSENEKEIIAFVLEIIDHKIYNKRFGYKKK